MIRVLLFFLFETTPTKESENGPAGRSSIGHLVTRTRRGKHEALRPGRRETTGAGGRGPRAAGETERRPLGPV